MKKLKKEEEGIIVSQHIWSSFMTFKHNFLIPWIEKSDLECVFYFYSFPVDRACVLLPMASPLTVNFLLCVWFQRCWRERRRFTPACCCRRWSWSNTSIATPSSASAWCSMHRVSSLRTLRPPVDAVRHHLQELFDSLQVLCSAGTESCLIMCLLLTLPAAIYTSNL